MNRGGSLSERQNRADVCFAISSLFFLISLIFYYYNNKTLTGGVSGATVLLVFSGVFAPLAGAIGTGCLSGLYGSYGKMSRYERD